MECLVSKYKGFIRFQLSKSGSGHNLLKDGATAFISNLKVQNSGCSKSFTLVATDSTTTKVYDVGLSAPSPLYKVVSLRFLITVSSHESQTLGCNGNTNSNKESFGKEIDICSLPCTVICWFGEPENADTQMGKVVNIEVIAGDFTGVLLLFRFEVPVFMIPSYKSSWMQVGKHIQINLPRIDAVDVDNQIVICSRGDRTIVRSVDNDITLQNLMGIGVCYTNYSSILERGKRRFLSLKENSTFYYDERLELCLSTKSKFSMQVYISELLELNQQPFVPSDKSARRIFMRVNPENEKSSTLLVAYTSFLSPNFFSVFQKLELFVVHCVETGSGESNEPYFVYLLETFA